MDPAPIRQKIAHAALNWYLHLGTYFHICILLGVQYALSCADCGYINPHCCAGMEAGMVVTLQTVLCPTCKQLYDVPVCRHGTTWTEIAMRCPKSKRHAVEAWSHPGPCPVCGHTLTKLGESAIWD